MGGGCYASEAVEPQEESIVDAAVRAAAPVVECGGGSGSSVSCIDFVEAKSRLGNVQASLTLLSLFCALTASK